MFYKFLHNKRYNFSISRDATTWPKEWGEILTKQYPKFSRTPLPNPLQKSADLHTALLKRKSARKAASSLDLKKISTLLQLSAGIKKHDGHHLTQEELNKTKRNYPSAGNRYPLELYILANQVDDLEKNVYHFNIIENSLEEVANINILDQALKQFKYEDHSYVWAQNAQAVIIITSMQYRSSIKYQDEGYLAALIECGHLAQNLLLTAASQDIAACPMYGFNRHGMHKTLDLDSDELVLYSIILA